ncbi:hypothetical protein JCM10213_008928 [Rhodosporidiobolus nylandii]
MCPVEPPDQRSRSETRSSTSSKSAGASPALPPPFSLPSSTNLLVAPDELRLHAGGTKDARQHRTVPRVKGAAADSFLPEEAPLAIGFSSASARWNQTHLSYALTMHLVETCLHFSSVMPFANLGSINSFSQRFLETSGRTDEMGSEQESIFGSSLVFPGLSSITSSADIPSELYTTIGIMRHAPTSSISGILAERVGVFDLARGARSLQKAAARLVLAWSAVELLHGEWQEERHRLLGILTLQGAAMLNEPECEGEGLDMLLYAVQELARAEIRQSLILDVPSAISPATHFRISGAQQSLPHLLVVPDSTLDLILNHHDPTLANWEPSYDSVENFVHHLNYVLAYAPHDRLIPAVQYCWQALDHLAQYLDQQHARVRYDPRYPGLPGPPEFKRPAVFFCFTVSTRCLALATRYGAQQALLRAAASSELLAEGRQRIFAELDEVAERVADVLQLLSRWPIQAYFVAQDLVIALEPYQSEFLADWAAQGQDQPARLVELLEGATTPSESAWSPPPSGSTSTSSDSASSGTGSSPLSDVEDAGNSASGLKAG